MIISNKEIIITSGLVKIAKLKSEWYDEIEVPESFIKELRKGKIRADIFTFRQRPPETTPMYNYYMEYVDLAAIPIESYDNWFQKQITYGERKAIRKAGKKGVIAKVTDFNDELIKGIIAIYNETPIRQGRPYTHYGKDFETVKSELLKGMRQCDFIGAFFNNDLIGFIQLGYAGKSAIPFGMVAKIEHRDKAPQTALIAKSIEICADKRISYLLYGDWLRGGIGEYKKRIGCIKVSVPRYYIPLSVKGKLVLKFNLHMGFRRLLPEKTIDYLVELRSKWYSKKVPTNQDSDME
jgi:hypothetical protein